MNKRFWIVNPILQFLIFLEHFGSEKVYYFTTRWSCDISTNWVGLCDVINKKTPIIFPSALRIPFKQWSKSNGSPAAATLNSQHGGRHSFATVESHKLETNAAEAMCHIGGPHGHVASGHGELCCVSWFIL